MVSLMPYHIGLKQSHPHQNNLEQKNNTLGESLPTANSQHGLGTGWNARIVKGMSPETPGKTTITTTAQ